MYSNLNQKMLQFAIDEATCAIIIVDKNERVVFTNKEHARLSGYPYRSLVGLTLQEMIDRKIVQDVASRKAMEKKEVVYLEQVNEELKDEPTHVMTQGVPYFNDLGKVEFVVCYIYAISEKRRIIEELEASNKKYNLELLHMKQEQGAIGNIVCRSKAMQDILHKADIIAQSDSTVLITGESGVGKNMLARYLHDHSPRKDHAFLVLNCAAVPEPLLESELFGYERGAFTGAQNQGKKGFFELANNGTLFLDEIGEMPMLLQAKLLNVLQDNTFFRIGGSKQIRVNTRVITATNANLPEMINNHQFRTDLYFRINALTLNIPSLRDRKDDIAVLIERFKEDFNGKYKLRKSIDSKAFSFLINYDYPGNIRELENLMERLILFSEGQVITLEDIHSLIETYRQQNGFQFDIGGKTWQELQESFEEAVLKEAKSRYLTTVEIAKNFNVNQSTISRKLRKYGL